MAAASALDMIESSITVLEDQEDVNAGYGSVLTLSGAVELDAGIVDGSTGAVGAVAGVTLEHPITLARLVLEKTPHAFMIGKGAEALAPNMAAVAIADAQRRRWEEARADGTLSATDFGAAVHVETVGAVALDDGGALAAGSSTGGVFGKLPGRVGDAPSYGAGFYAGSVSAAVGTGVGELFIETLACKRVCDTIDAGAEPQDACEEAIRHLGSIRSTPAGLLALRADGAVGVSYRGGSWAVGSPDGPIHAACIA